MPEQAIGHAQAAGDYDRVVRLILELQQPVWARRPCRDGCCAGWSGSGMSRQPSTTGADRGARLIDLRAPRPAQRGPSAGRPRRNVRPSAGILPDGQHDRGHARPTCARSCAARASARCGRDAQLAWEGLSPASPYRATMLYTEGISFLLEGDPTPSRAPFSPARLNLATHSGSLPLAGLILAEQCGVAAERNDWAEVTTPR